MSNSEKNKLIEAAREQLIKRVKDNLPHLYGFKFYKWSREFFDSTNKMILLVAGNQLSKSSTQIRKSIHWATETDLWPDLWLSTPRQFWYLYPDLGTATAEFENKWVPEFMPRGEMKDDPKYGWTAVYKTKQIHYIQWNNGLRTYFHAYSKDIHRMQAASVSYIATDEELPEDMYPELKFRLAATNGYFSMAFTATKGQLNWSRAMEKIGTRHELFPNALKLRVSAYDCLVYEDGDENTPWTIKRIKEMEESCTTENEIKKRIHGHFVMDEGLKYQSFDYDKNVVEPYKIGKDWAIYGGVDIGSGGKGGHPAAMVLVAVRPDYQKGVVFRGWRGEGEDTTARDVLDRYRLLRGNLKPVAQFYDWASADFKNYASRLGESFIKAEKSHELGEDLINNLFKSGMLDIFNIPELEGLPEELSSLTRDIPKRKAKDDFIDALRYTVTSIPWDHSAVADMYAEYKPPKKELSPEALEIEQRRGRVFDDVDKEIDILAEEIDYFNGLLD